MSVPAKLAKPALKNLNDKNLRTHFLVSGIGALVGGLAYVYFLERKHMMNFQKWIDNYDDKKEYARLKKHHVFRSLDNNGNVRNQLWL